ncbi:histidine kinase [Pseudonocardia sp. K10HN5]|uniref:Histidine kinase n=1 Tax=Pseudonocardia acidicola TaxID=2724939 RepID=A0ABX1SK72_9PSEU|nr:FIST N-terminal domain-containing protein [Pseudonocardia acidicola]NMI01965.1 histidine kinase [Pseudonocardia acidicola]
MPPSPGRRFGDGLAVGPDLRGAAEVAVAQALAPLGGATPDLLCVFVAGGGRGADGDAAAQAGLRAMELGGARTTIGATAGGVIGDGRGVEDVPAVAAWAAILPGVEIRPFRLTVERSETGADVTGLPQLRADDRLAVLLVDPYSFPTGGFLQRCNAVLPGFPLVGGLASVASGPGGNRLFLDGEVLLGGAVGALLGGDVAARAIVSQGCRPIGPTMVVTRAERNLLVELAGAPAYTRLGEIVTALPPAEQELVGRGLQLGVAMNEYAEEHGRGDFLIRGVLGIDVESGAVAVGDVVGVGQSVRFQVRDAAAADEDLTELLAGAVADGPARGALLFSCNGRGRAMFPSADHDVGAVRAGLGTDGVAGFFAAGEIGPVGGRNHLHGFTASVLAFQ